MLEDWGSAHALRVPCHELLQNWQKLKLCGRKEGREEGQRGHRVEEEADEGEEERTQAGQTRSFSSSSESLGTGA